MARTLIILQTTNRESSEIDLNGADGLAEFIAERDQKHIAHIKALHQFIGDHEEEEGIWIPRVEFKDIPKHDVEGGDE